MQTDVETVDVAEPVHGVETPNRPAAVVETFVRCIESGRIGSAIRMLSGRIIETVGAQKLESIFSMSSLEIGELGGIESMDVQTRAFSRDHVEMLLTIWYGDHKVETEMVELVRENGYWRISMEEIIMPGVDRIP